MQDETTVDAFHIEYMIRDLLESFTGPKAVCQIFDGNCKPTGKTSAVVMACLDIDGVIVDMDDGSRFKVKVTKMRRRGRPATATELAATPAEPLN
jgi:hypothetical protein